MKEIETAQGNLGAISTLDRMVQLLGFQDVTSFVLVSIFLVVATAFVISCAIFLVKKRKERLAELNRVVLEVQASRELPQSEEVVATLRHVPLAEKKAVPLQPLVEPIIPKPMPAQPRVERAVIEEPVLPPMAAPAPLQKDEKKDLGAALKQTRGGFIEKLSRIFSRGQAISDEDFEEMEAILFTADIGVKTAQKLLDRLRARVSQEKNADKGFLRTVLKEEMRAILESAPSVETTAGHKPSVLMFVGVNGAGKTTSIGKLGAQLAMSGHKVVFGAGDTFRAAATTQLQIWGERAHAEVVSGKENTDSAAVLFEAIERGKSQHADFVLCDTAGRLHTKSSLMDELKKVHRVLGKAQEGAPHEVYLVVDATMGQNAIAQAREFAEATPLTGVILSKLDGTAKGGVAVGIVDELKVPIRYIGIGEQVGNLRDFNASLFVDALFEET